MSKEAMKLALEALEYIHEGANNQGPHTGISWRCVSNKAEPAITALRQALANEALDKMAENARELGLDYEPAKDNSNYRLDPPGLDRSYTPPQPAQQEPVAWMYEDMMGLVGVRVQKEKPIVARPVTPLYTSPPAQRKPLTDEQMWSLWNSQGDDAMEQTAAITFARAIEAAHGIKENT